MARISTATLVDMLDTHQKASRTQFAALVEANKALCARLESLEKASKAHHATLEILAAAHDALQDAPAPTPTPVTNSTPLPKAGNKAKTVKAKGAGVAVPTAPALELPAGVEWKPLKWDVDPKHLPTQRCSCGAAGFGGAKFAANHVGKEGHVVVPFFS